MNVTLAFVNLTFSIIPNFLRKEHVAPVCDSDVTCKSSAIARHQSHALWWEINMHAPYSDYINFPLSYILLSLKNVKYLILTSLASALLNPPPSTGNF